MNEIVPDIFTWAWFSEPHGYNFNGHLVRHPAGNLCIDPVPPDSADVAEIERMGVTRILLTNRNHSRAATMALGVRPYASYTRTASDSASAACASMPSMFAAHPRGRQPKCDVRRPAVTNRHRRVICGLATTNHDRSDAKYGHPAPVVVGVMNSGWAVTNDTKRGMRASAILTRTQDAPIV